MVKEIRDILVSIQAVIGSPDVKEAVKLSVPLLESLRKASDAANLAIRRADSAMGSMETGYGDNSQIRRNLVDLTRQLQDTARSIRQLADFVERHPEALIRGKAASTP
jgi:paraquat-inducible protein B